MVPLQPPGIPANPSPRTRWQQARADDSLRRKSSSFKTTKATDAQPTSTNSPGRPASPETQLPLDGSETRGMPSILRLDSAGDSTSGSVSAIGDGKQELLSADDAWDIGKWVQSLNVHELLHRALLSGMASADPKDGPSQLRYIQQTFGSAEYEVRYDRPLVKIGIAPKSCYEREYDCATCLTSTNWNN
eukprot:6212231-Pleurochrysis_carterae.AAC.2